MGQTDSLPIKKTKPATNAKQNKYRKIVGFLSDADIIPEDKNHKERQISFYKKFGFNISNSDKTTIELIL